MSTAKDPSLVGLNDCGCCQGREVEVPSEISNRPGLKAIIYRIGRHAEFKESLLASLSKADFPALQKLTTREADDFTIALLDAWAAVADVLTFYQERIANESFLRTATEKLSVQELARLTGYALSPGVAASAYLAFTLEEAPDAGSFGTNSAGSGTASQAVSAVMRQTAAMIPESISIAVGTQVQSIPGQDEQAQVFETVEAIEARPKWNKIKPLLTKTQTLSTKAESLLFEGTSLKLKAGDRLLVVVGLETVLRQIEKVTEDFNAKTTEVELVPLAKSSSGSAKTNSPIKLYLYGTAGSSSSSGSGTVVTETLKKSLLEMAASTTEESIKIMEIFKQFQEASASISTGLSLIPYIPLKLFSQTGVYVMRVCASLFGYNAPDWHLVHKNDLTKYINAKGKAVTDWDVTEGKWSVLELDAVYSQIVPGSWTAIVENGHFDQAVIDGVKSVSEVGVSDFGMSARVTCLVLDSEKISIDSMATLRKQVVYAQSEELTLADLPRTDDVKDDKIELGSLQKKLKAGQTIVVAGEPVGSSETWASEVAVIQSLEHKSAYTVLTLTRNLTNIYNRDTVVINANVALATHGETFKEILGSGDAAQSFLSFRLKQTPLTYIAASTASGTESTMKIYVNDILWKEVSNFLESGPDDRHYVVETDDEGKTTVLFGDGNNGSRPPTGQNNIAAVYRKGLGLDGQVKKDQLSLLLTRSYGLKEVTNPLDAEGGDDSETLAMSRVNAPLKVKTLDRTVSLQDYEDFALAFAGVAKALATWTWFGEKRGVFLTIAESQSKTSGSKSAGSSLSVEKKLRKALLKAGNPYVPIRVEPYRPVYFRLALSIKVQSEYQEDKVKAAVKKALRAEFSFSVRSLGQPVTLSEVMAVVQGVAGVEAVDVNGLYRSDDDSAVNDRLPAEFPKAGQDGSCQGAELLTLHSDPLDELGVMP